MPFKDAFDTIVRSVDTFSVLSMYLIFTFFFVQYKVDNILMDNMRNKKNTIERGIIYGVKTNNIYQLFLTREGKG